MDCRKHMMPEVTEGQAAASSGSCRSRLRRASRLRGLRTATVFAARRSMLGRGRLPAIAYLAFRSPHAGHFIPVRIKPLENPSASGCQAPLPAPACDSGSMVPSHARRPMSVLTNGRIMTVDECIDWPACPYLSNRLS